jgi:hypothetical protein
MSLENILEKIHQTPVPRGPDSSLAIELLRRVYHVKEIVPITKGEQS